MTAVGADETAAFVVDKGLRPHSIGLFGATVLGVTSTAPGYSIAVTAGLLAISVGTASPVLILLGFLPILCMTITQQELVAHDPDAGTVFVWVSRAFGPHVGWIAGFTANIAVVIAMANLTNVAGTYTLSLVGPDGAATRPATTIAAGCCWLALATWLGVRGVCASGRAQTALLLLGFAVLIVFAAIAAAKVLFRTAGAQAITPSFSWLNPLAGHNSGALATGLLLAIFLFWGWDAPAAVAEEADTAARTPRLAMMIAALTVLGSYLVIMSVMQMFAGVGADGIGLANRARSGDVLGSIGVAVVGPWFATLTRLAILASTVGCLIGVVIPSARSLLSMGAYRALPAALTRLHPTRRSPVAAAVALSASCAVFLIVLSIISRDVLTDALGALTLVIAFCYTLIGLACLWTFRRTMRSSFRNLACQGIAPAVGVLILAWALVQSAITAFNPVSGATVLLGVGGIVVISAGLLLFGVFAMIVWQLRAPAFFRGETLEAGNPRCPPRSQI